MFYNDFGVRESRYGCALSRLCRTTKHIHRCHPRAGGDPVRILDHPPARV